MKLKKLILSTGVLATVTAPLAVAVSCNEKKDEFPSEWKTENDEKWNGVYDYTDPKNPVMIKPGILTFLQNDANLKLFPLAPCDIFDYVVNQEEDGLLPITRLQDFANVRGMNKYSRGSTWDAETWNAVIDDLVDTTVLGENGQPQSVTQLDQSRFTNINAFKTINITKKQINGNINLLANTYKQIKSIINSDSNAKFGIFVQGLKDDKEDDKDTIEGYNQGEYAIHIFKLKNQPSSELDAATKLFTDKKIAIDKNLLKQIGGTYMTGSGYGTVRFNAREAVDSPISIFHDKVDIKTQSPDFLDRSVGDALKDWTAFGPTSALTDADKQAVKDVKFVAYYQKDRKTQIQNLIVTVALTGDRGKTTPDPTDDWSFEEDSLKITNIKTIAIPVPELMEVEPKVDFAAMSDADLTKVTDSIVDDLSFKKIYDILSGVISYKNMIAGMAPSAMPVVIDLYGVLRTMWETQNVIKNLTAFRSFINELPNIDSNFNLNQFMEIIKNQKGLDLEGFTSFGGKRYSVLVVTSRFYNDLKKFLEIHPEFKDQSRLVGGKNA